MMEARGDRYIGLHIPYDSKLVTVIHNRIVVASHYVSTTVEFIT